MRIGTSPYPTPTTSQNPSPSSNRVQETKGNNSYLQNIAIPGTSCNPSPSIFSQVHHPLLNNYVSSNLIPGTSRRDNQSNTSSAIFPAYKPYLLPTSIITQSTAVSTLHSQPQIETKNRSTVSFYSYVSTRVVSPKNTESVVKRQKLYHSHQPQNAIVSQSPDFSCTISSKIILNDQSTTQTPLPTLKASDQ